MVKKKKKPTIYWPEENSNPSTTGGSMRIAGPHVFSIHLAATAVALRTQHGSTKQAQSRMLLLIICGIGTTEDHRGSKQVSDLWRAFHWKGTSSVHLLKMTGLIEKSSVILGEINQLISFSRISRGKFFRRNLKHLLSCCVSGLKKN